MAESDTSVKAHYICISIVGQLESDIDIENRLLSHSREK